MSLSKKLAAGSVIFIDDKDFGSMARGLSCSRQTGRAGSNYYKVIIHLAPHFPTIPLSSCPDFP